MQLANSTMTTAPSMASLSSMKVEQTINFIDAVKRHQAIYDTTHQDYKNIEEKTKAWRSIAREMGITVEAAKRKWKNLRDSYTKYLRSFRVGTKTSRKYQFWAHAEHMDFLRPFQGPGRSSSVPKSDAPSYYPGANEDDAGCDLGFEMVEKCYPDEPVADGDVVPRTVTYATNGTPFNNTYDRKTVSALHEVDSTTMFFLSLAKTVREMPRQKQAKVKMLCMKAVHDAEMEVDNSISEGESFSSSVKIISGEESSPTFQNGNNEDLAVITAVCEQSQGPPRPQPGNEEHFLYVMSPSRVETMIDLSSDDDSPKA